MANMGGYALANWPTTTRQKVRRRGSSSGGKFARGGFTAGCRDRPCVSDHQVWGTGWEGGQGYASLTDIGQCKKMVSLPAHNLGC